MMCGSRRMMTTNEMKDESPNPAMHRIGSPRHDGCVRTRRATGADPVIAIVRRQIQKDEAGIWL
jgi:hypothetical protein